MKRALVLVLLVGCRGQERTCSEAVEHFGQRLMKLRSRAGLTTTAAEDAEAARPIIDGLRRHCIDDAWPEPVVRCVRGAASPIEFEGCEQQLSGPQRAALESVGSAAATAAYRARTRADTAMAMAKKYAFEAFPQWAAAHPDRACPDKLSDLDSYLPDAEAVDPWGHDYKMLCGPTLPPEAKGIGVVSAAEDGKYDTSDDIKSWEAE